MLYFERTSNLWRWVCVWSKRTYALSRTQGDCQNVDQQTKCPPFPSFHLLAGTLIKNVFQSFWFFYLHFRRKKINTSDFLSSFASFWTPSCWSAARATNTNAVCESMNKNGKHNHTFISYVLPLGCQTCHNQHAHQLSAWYSLFYWL